MSSALPLSMSNGGSRAPLRRRTGERAFAPAPQPAWDSRVGLQDALGNRVVFEALSGQGLGGLGPVVAAEVALSSAGLHRDGSAGFAPVEVLRRAHAQERVSARAANDAIRASSGRALDADTRERM